MTGSSLYAIPRVVSHLADCDFYHTMEVPGHGVVEGQWDLRGQEAQYLGGVNLKEKRVLEVGPASGFLSFYMERQGAEVVAYDLSEHQSWDIVPFSQSDYSKQVVYPRKAHMRRINNSFWLAHRAYESRVRVVYGNIYSVPAEIGQVDIATFGAVLLHVRDPFLGLESALKLTREVVIVTEVAPWPGLTGATMGFLPDFTKGEPLDTWWRFTPDVIQRFIGVFGFEDSAVTHHTQKYSGRKEQLFTVVGRRTQPIAADCV